MYVLPFINRVKTQCPIFQGRVKLPDAMVLIKGASDTPSLFGYWHKKPAHEMSRSHTKQQCTDVFKALVIAESVNQAGTAEPMADALKELDNALIGWSPADGYSPVVRVDAEVINMNQYIFWVEVLYETRYYHTAIP